MSEDPILKVLLVDDEILALNYLNNLIDWEKNGFHVVDKAKDGKEALELYKKYQPEIIISDIKMAKSDGIELTSKLKQLNQGVVVVLLSAYKDFEYAQKAIEFGAEKYIIKHELDAEFLLSELKKIKIKLLKKNKKEKIYQKYFLNQLIYNDKNKIDNDLINLGNRFCIIFVHKSDIFKDGNFYKQNLDFDMHSIISFSDNMYNQNILFFISKIKITDNNLILLYEIKNSNSKNIIDLSIMQECKSIIKILKNDNKNINILWSEEIDSDNISKVFQKMSSRIRYSMFWEYNSIYNLNKFKNIEVEEKSHSLEHILDLEKSIYSSDKEYEEQIEKIFDKMIKYHSNINYCKETIHLLDSILRKIEKKENIKRINYSKEICKMDEIKIYYIECFKNINKKINEIQNLKYSKLVLDMIRFIQKNYYKDINLESMGETFNKNGIYLGNVFKKETGITFLKFLTNIRIEEAKLFLESSDYNIGEVSQKVGYKTSQYFSQVFLKTTGMKPQEYKNGANK